MKRDVPDLNLQSLADDIRAGLTDAALMEKHKLTSHRLSKAFERLLIKAFITPQELDERTRRVLTEDEMAELAADLELGLFHEELKEKYGLSEHDLREHFRVMVAEGLASEEDVNSAVKAVNPRKVVQLFLADMSKARIKEKCHFSEEELAELFKALLARSFLSPDELEERSDYEELLEDTGGRLRGLGPLADEAKLIRVYSVTEQREEELVRSLLDSAGILHVSRRDDEGTEFLVHEVMYRKARQVLAGLPEMVTVYTGTDPTAVERAASMLEDAEIKYLSSTWHGGPYDGAIEFLVDEREAEEARELLANLPEMEASFQDEVALEESEIGGLDPREDKPADGTHVHCAACSNDPVENTNDTARDFWIRLLAIAVMIIVVAYALGLIPLGGE